MRFETGAKHAKQVLRVSLVVWVGIPVIDWVATLPVPPARRAHPLHTVRTLCTRVLR